VLVYKYGFHHDMCFHKSTMRPGLKASAPRLVDTAFLRQYVGCYSLFH
jgi:hypothetical protein